MSGKIDPIRPVRLVRRETRPTPEPEAAATQTVNLTINLGPSAAEPAPAPLGAAAGVEAQLLAHGAATRGLRGGQWVLQAARAVYLSAQWSGPRDRRGRAGRITQTEA